MQDGKPVLKIIDFGIAKATSQRLTDASLYTEVGQVIGTLEYMSPEQAELSALDIDTRADVYALGAMLYELLTGTTPLDRKRLKQAALMEMLRLIKEQEPPRPSTRLSESRETLPSVAAQRRTEPARLTKEVRGELDWIVMKCLEKDRTRRYETANALACDVERYLADVPVEAYPPSRSYRLGKFARKYRAALSAATAFVLLLAIAAAVSAWLAVRATQAEATTRQERDDKEQARQQAVAEQQRAEKAEALAKARLEEVSKEKARADEEAHIAAAANEFLQKQLLGQADIGNQPLLAGAAIERNPNVTVKELLDRAAREIEGQFAGQPLTEAAIRLTIGDAYRALGRYPEAQQHLERALRLRTAKLGADHPDTLTSKSDLAILYWSQGQYAKAEPLFKEVLQGQTAKLGAEHPETLASKSDLAMLYQKQGQYAKAEPLLKEALEGHTAKLGANHPDTLTSKNNLAALYYSQGQYAKAELLYKEVLEGRTAKLGTDHPDTLGSEHNLASLYRVQGQYAKAEPLFKEVLQGFTAKLGADHPDTLTSENNLAELYQAQGQYAKAESLLKEVLQGQTAKLDADHPETLRTKSNLASLYLAQREYAKAEPLLKEVLQGFTAKLGADHPYTLTSKNNLAGLYQEQGQYAKAETLFKEALEGQTAKLGADHPYTLKSKRNLDFLRNLRTAEERYRDNLAKLGPDHLKTLLARRDLAQSYLVTNRLDEAEPLLVEILDRMKTLPNDDPVRLFTIGLLHQCLMRRERTMPDSWLTFQSRSLLGGALLGLKKYADAEPLLRQGYEGMKQRQDKIPFGSKDRLHQALERLVQLYEATGNKDQAAKWRKELQALQAKSPEARHDR
jgi:tetratricopeptide (TPR) repeat protein